MKNWIPVAGITIDLQRKAGRRTGSAALCTVGLKLVLPLGLARAEERRMADLLVWRALGHAGAPEVERLARRLNRENLGRHLAGVDFRRQMRRWGSCSSSDNIHLSHRLLAAPPELLQAVLLHELAHLGCLRHDREFWGTLASMDPDHRRHREELGAYGRIWARWWDANLRDLLRRGWIRLCPPDTCA